LSRGEADELSSFAVSGTSGGAVVCAVTGEIDISNADEFAAQLARAATRGREVVVDLSGVTFLASAGIRVLIDAAVGGASGRLAVVTSPEIETIVRICGLGAYAPCRPDREAAVRALRPPGCAEPTPSTDR
jgi:anti-sigma B factor antagonist